MFVAGSVTGRRVVPCAGSFVRDGRFGTFIWCSFWVSSGQAFQPKRGDSFSYPSRHQFEVVGQLGVSLLRSGFRGLSVVTTLGKGRDFVTFLCTFAHGKALGSSVVWTDRFCKATTTSNACVRGRTWNGSWDGPGLEMRAVRPFVDMLFWGLLNI